ncbi:hypothetical protein BDV10DRAFT_196764 [Aspergillus recurvatus]
MMPSQLYASWAQRQQWPHMFVRASRYVYGKVILSYSGKVIFVLLRHVVYPQVFRGRSRYWFLHQSIYWAGTLTCNFIKTHTLPSIAARAGNLAVLNFVPLVLAGRLSLAADLLGIPTRSYTALHVIISIRDKGWSPEQPIQLYGLVAASAFALSIAFLIVRRCLYEVFIKMHYILALVALVAIWRHVRLQKVFTQLYMVVGSGILIGTTLLHWSLLVVAQVTRAGDSAQIVIPVNRPFTIYAVMTVYIWLPSVSFLSLFYSHLFIVTWWDVNEQGKAASISLLVQKKDGFTRKLIDHAAKEFLTWIDRPYREQMLKYHPKQIFVAWELDDKSNLDWVYNWMDQLLLQDQNSYILRFGLYLPSSQVSSEHLEPWNSKHDRIWRLSGKIDPWKVVSTDFWARTGSSLVTVSANKHIQKGIAEVIRDKMTHVINLLALPFQPGMPKIHRNQKTNSEQV